MTDGPTPRWKKLAAIGSAVGALVGLPGCAGMSYSTYDNRTGSGVAVNPGGAAVTTRSGTSATTVSANPNEACIGTGGVAGSSRVCLPTGLGLDLLRNVLGGGNAPQPPQGGVGGQRPGM